MTRGNQSFNLKPMANSRSLEGLFEKRNPFIESLLLEPRSLLFGLTLLAVTNILDALNPWLLGKAINALEKGSQLEIATWSGAFMGVMAGLAATRFLWRFFFGRYHTLVAHWLRVKLTHRLLQAPWNFWQNHSVGDLTSRVINDVNQWRQAIGEGLLVFVDGLMLLGMILPLMFWIQPQWFWKTLLIFPILPFFIWLILKGFFYHSHQAQEKLGQMSSQISENVLSIKMIKSFLLQSRWLKRFQIVNKACARNYRQMALFDSLWELSTTLAVAIGTVILLILAYEQAIDYQLDLGAFVAYQRYLIKLTWPVSAIGLGLIRFQMGFASWKRISQALHQPQWAQWGTKPLTQIWSLELRSFQDHSNSNAPLKTHVEWTIHQGQKWLILGPIGSGKTCLLETLAGIYPHANSVYINGEPLWSWDYNRVKKLMAYVPQEPVLFSDSIERNLNPENLNIPSLQVETVLKGVSLWDEIQNWPQKLNTRVGEKGVTLSGGQKQRLALARALLVQPRWLLLDDCLSAVDKVTQEKILKFIDSLGGTWILATQRPEPLTYATHVLVLNKGHVAFMGPKNNLTWEDFLKLFDNQSFNHTPRAL